MALNVIQFDSTNDPTQTDLKRPSSRVIARYYFDEGTFEKGFIGKMTTFTTLKRKLKSVIL